MSLKTKGPPKSVGRSHGRRPYIGDKDDTYRDSMKRVPRSTILEAAQQKKSQFDKPYLSDNYHEMEHFQPPPFTNVAWPDLVWPTFPGPVPTHPTQEGLPSAPSGAPLSGPDSAWFEEHGGFGGVPCMIAINGPHNCTQDTNAEWTDRVNIFFLLANLAFMSSLAEFISSARVYVNGVRRHDFPRDLTGTSHIELDAPTGGWTPGDKILVVVPDKYDKNHGQSLCWAKEIVTCFVVDCCAGTPDTFEWNTGSNPTTITAGGYANIYVQGGCPDYTYTVSGTGATWNSNGSTTLVSSNLSERLDLADGT